MQVKCLVWHPDRQKYKFMVLCWNKIAAIYGLQKSQQYSKYQRAYKPIICVQPIILDIVPTAGCWNQYTDHIYIGFMDGSIRIYDNKLKQINKLKQRVHHSAINSLHCYNYNNKNIIISTAYQSIVCFWHNDELIYRLDVKNKIYVSAFNQDQGILALATQGQYITIIDVKQNMKIVNIKSDLGQGSQIQSIAINVNGKKMIYGTVDGRICVANIQKTASQYYLKSFIQYKSNVSRVGYQPVLFPVNSVGFNCRNYDWVFAAGSDGQMVFLDTGPRTLLTKLDFNKNPICCATVSHDGKFIVYANGNDWHQGVDGQNKWANRIGIHQISQKQIK